MRQRTFTVIPSNLAKDASPKAPMTSKQVKAAYKKSTAVQRRSRSEERREEKRLKDLIEEEHKREVEVSRRNARSARKKMKDREREETLRQERQAKGLPPKPSSPSQKTLTGFITRGQHGPQVEEQTKPIISPDVPPGRQTDERHAQATLEPEGVDDSDESAMLCELLMDEIEQDIIEAKRAQRQGKQPGHRHDLDARPGREPALGSVHGLDVDGVEHRGPQPAAKPTSAAPHAVGAAHGAPELSWTTSMLPSTAPIQRWPSSAEYVDLLGQGTTPSDGKGVLSDDCYLPSARCIRASLKRPMREAPPPEPCMGQMAKGGLTPSFGSDGVSDDDFPTLSQLVRSKIANPQCDITSSIAREFLSSSALEQELDGGMPPGNEPSPSTVPGECENPIVVPSSATNDKGSTATTPTVDSEPPQSSMGSTAPCSISTPTGGPGGKTQHRREKTKRGHASLRTSCSPSPHTHVQSPWLKKANRDFEDGAGDDRKSKRARKR